MAVSIPLLGSFSTIASLGSLFHGKHRVSATEIRGNTTQIASAITGGTFDPLAGIAANQRATLHAVYTKALMSHAFDLAESPVEDTGIKVGEIIAWRAWGVSRNWLYSINFKKEWHPGKAVESEKVDRGWGIHAFKDRIRAIDYAESWLTTEYTLQHRHYFGSHLFAIGQVAMWGDMWEFENGWHGQYARVENIEMVFGCDVHDPEKLLSLVRETYGVGPAHD